MISSLTEDRKLGSDSFFDRGFAQLNIDPLKGFHACIGTHCLVGSVALESQTLKLVQAEGFKSPTDDGQLWHPPEELRRVLLSDVEAVEDDHNWQIHHSHTSRHFSRM